MNGDLRVGGVNETVTVSGEAPVVDVTSARTEQTIDGKTVSEIPTSRLYSSLTQLVPALNVQGNDVGGSQGNVFSVFQIHGGRRNEGQVLVDGMSGGYQGMGVSGYAPEVGTAQEIVFSLSGGLGEATTGGPQLNIIGKQGGNTFAGSFFINGSGSAFVNDNLTRRAEGQGAVHAAETQEAVGHQSVVRRPDQARQAVVLRHLSLPDEPADGRQHVGQHECRRQQQVDLRSGFQQAIRG